MAGQFAPSADGDDRLLPTPTMMDGTRAGVELDPDRWEQKRDRKAADGVNLHFHLSVAMPMLVRDQPLLPTPQTVNRKSERAMRSSSEDGGNGRRSGGGQSSPPGLEQVVERLLPTPTKGDGEGGGKRAGIRAEDLTKASGDGGASRLRDVVPFLAGDRLLPTPRREGFDAGNHRGKPDGLDQTVRQLLPTPRSRDKGSAGDYAAGEGGPNLMESVRNLLPTPRTTDGTDAPANRSAYLDRLMSGEAGRTPRLSEMALYMGDTPLLPTPRASKVTDEDAESWRARQRDGKVATMPLSLAVRTAGDTEEPGEPGEGEGSWGTGQLLPTPTSQAAKHGAPTPWEVARREVQPGNLWETVADLADRDGTSASSAGSEG